MRGLFIIAIAFLAGAPALAYDRRGNNDRSRPLDPDEMRDYSADAVGDHYEWTLYGKHYHKPNYDHRYQWSNEGLSAVSLCIEVDNETGGRKFREMVEDDYCPKLETEYVWEAPVEGHPERCLKRDVDTAGARFVRAVNRELCTKPPVFYRWEKQAITGKPRCFELDSSTAGQRFREQVADRLCPTKLNVEVAYGRKRPSYEPVPSAPREVSASRAPASVPAGKDQTFWEDPEDLVEHVHYHRVGDKIHHR